MQENIKFISKKNAVFFILAIMIVLKLQKTANLLRFCCGKIKNVHKSTVNQHYTLYIVILVQIYFMTTDYDRLPKMSEVWGNVGFWVSEIVLYVWYILCLFCCAFVAL